MFSTPRNHSISLTLTVILTAGIASLSAADVPSTPIQDDGWKINVIQPGSFDDSLAQADVGPVLAAAQPSTAPAEPVSNPVAGDAAHVSSAAPAIVPAMSYTEAYNSVPFSRAEYEANPSYRSEAAMEIMFRQLRPTTIVKQFTPRTLRYPDFYQYPYARYPYRNYEVRPSWNAWGISYPLYAR